MTPTPETVDQPGLRLAVAGNTWDAIQAPLNDALGALNELEKTPDGPGAVLVDQERSVAYFLIPPRSSDTWSLANTIPHGAAMHLWLPDPAKTRPPGLYWLNPPRDGHEHTPADLLHTALETVTRQPHAAGGGGA